MNGFSLIGETHKEVVSLLKELPMNVCVVCSRLIPPTVSEEDEDGDDVQLTLKELLAEFNEKVCVMIFKRKSHVRKYSQPLPWHSTLSSGVSCFH